MIDLALGRRRHGAIDGRVLAIVGAVTTFVLTGAPIIYMLWPQPAAVAVDAPTLPITIGGMTFNVPPAAIRIALQRRPGIQARIDLAYSWPSLRPPDPTPTPSSAAPPDLAERLFVTIAASDGTLPPEQRFNVIYPRYTDAPENLGSNGLAVRRFRAATPYQGEELIYDPAAPERFLLRCSRAISSTPGMCLNERRIGGADVTVRFPRDWLTDWRGVAERVDRLLSGLQPHPG